MAEKNVRIRTIVLLIMTIVLCVGVAIYHGYYKEYFYEDEVLSFTLSNSHKGAYFNLKPGTWYQGEELYDYLYVHDGEGFDWQNVIYNQKQDSHPPVYALLLHASSSLFSGDFSKWAGISLNLVFFVLLMFFYYLLIRELFPDRPYFAAIMCLILGLTLGIQTMAVYIRMYVILMTLAVLCILWHVKMLHKNGTHITSFIVLAAMDYLGVMTHWFYIFILFFIALFYCLLILHRKMWRGLIGYLAATAVAAGMVLFTWRVTVWQLFSEETGNDAVTQELSAGSILQKLKEMTHLVNEAVFGSKLRLVLLVLVCYLIYLLVQNRKNLKNVLQLRPELKPELSMVIFSTIMFYLTVSVVTPYVAYRYVSPVFPFMILLTVLALEKVMNAVLRSGRLGMALIVLFFILPELSVLHSGLVDVDRRIIDEYSSLHSDDICLFYSGISPEENVFELRKFDRIYVYADPEFTGVEGIAEADEVLIYIPAGEDIDPYINSVQRANPSLRYADRLYVAYYSTCYVVSSEL